MICVEICCRKIGMYAGIGVIFPNPKTAIENKKR